MFKSNKGFTLVELIVVIAILAILAGIAIPAYSGYIKKANDAAIETELGAISTAAMAANATKGEIDQIKVTATAIEVEAEGDVFATSFGSDFMAFYDNVDGPGAQEASDPKAWELSIKDDLDLKNSSYENKTATWTAANGWEAK